MLAEYSPTTQTLEWSATELLCIWLHVRTQHLITCQRNTHVANCNVGRSILCLLTVCGVAGQVVNSAGGPSWEIAILSTPPPHHGGEEGRRGAAELAWRGALEHQIMNWPACLAKSPVLGENGSRAPLWGAILADQVAGGHAIDRKEEEEA